VLTGRAYLSPCCAEAFAGNHGENAYSDGDQIKKLTARERDVLLHLVRGKTSKDIARILGISFRTVDQHRASLLMKFGVKNTVEMLGIVLRDDLLP